MNIKKIVKSGVMGYMVALYGRSAARIWANNLDVSLGLVTCLLKGDAYRAETLCIISRGNLEAFIEAAGQEWKARGEKLEAIKHILTY
jgi:hypothetical protein